MQNKTKKSCMHFFFFNNNILQNKRPILFLFEKKAKAPFKNIDLKYRRDLKRETFNKVSIIILRDNTRLFNLKGLFLFISKKPNRPTNLKFLSQNNILK